MQVTGVERLRQALAGSRPRRLSWLGRARTAAVAVIVRSVAGDDFELLFIRRPRRRGDRWSGDVAFPGGLVDARDADVEAAARREAREEVGLDLGRSIGRLPALLTAAPGRARPMRVVPIVFEAPAGAHVDPSPDEVADAFWMRWSDLARRRPAHVWRRVARVPVRVRVVDLDGRPLWGLTLLMVGSLRRLLG